MMMGLGALSSILVLAIGGPAVARGEMEFDDFGVMLTYLAWLAVPTWQLRLSGFLSTRHMMIPIALLLPVAGAGLVALWGKGLVWRVLVVLALLEPIEVAARDYHSNHLPRLAALS